MSEWIRSSSLVVLVLGLAAGCGRREVTVEARGLTVDEKRAVEAVAEVAVRDARQSLSSLPRTIVLRVETSPNVIPETGENGTTVPPAEIVWSVGPGRDVLALVRHELRKTLFHEAHHLARAQRVTTRTLLDAVVAEGLATAFERDVAGARPPWGEPVPEIEAWAREVLAVGEAGDGWDAWLVQHPDGRRWVGMRVGTWLVDRVKAKTGRSAAELVGVESREIVRLADVPVR